MARLLVLLTMSTMPCAAVRQAYAGRDVSAYAPLDAYMHGRFDLVTRYMARHKVGVCAPIRAPVDAFVTRAHAQKYYLMDNFLSVFYNLLEPMWQQYMVHLACQHVRTVRTSTLSAYLDTDPGACTDAVRALEALHALAPDVVLPDA